MQSLWQRLTSNLNAFRQEWSKARSYMLAEKRRNMAHWRQQHKDKPTA